MTGSIVRRVPQDTNPILPAQVAKLAKVANVLSKCPGLKFVVAISPVGSLPASSISGLSPEVQQKFDAAQVFRARFERSRGSFRRALSIRNDFERFWRVFEGCRAPKGAVGPSASQEPQFRYIL